jgi:formylglycine-generating enzyme required for sulfatase activity
MLRLVAACTVLLSCTAARAAEPKVAERWALLIGVDDYATAQDLAYCGADQRDLQIRLRDCGFADDHIFLLHDRADDNKYRPSQRNIERELGVVLNLAAEDDLLIVAFSGHGVSLGGKSYLCPSDAALDDPATLVSLDAIYDRLNNCAARFKLMLVDACRNDPRPGGGRSLSATEGTKQLARSLQEIKLPEGVVLLNSCAPGEISWEEQAFGHGVYMHHVLEALSGSADTNADGAVSLNELQAFAGTKTKTYVARKFSASQRPFFKSEGESDLMEFALLPVKPSAVPGGKEITNSIGMRLTLIPGGEFQMGSPAFDSDAQEDEKPQHRVRITKPFYLGTHEVTNGQFAQFVVATSYRTDAEKDGKGGWGYNPTTFSEQKPEFNWRNTGFTQTDDHPVVNVSWNDAVAFCEWLCGNEGKSYSLPSEAQWEYACRAGTTTRYVTGNSPDSVEGSANVQDASFETKFPKVDYAKYPSFKFNDGWSFTAPAGRFKANAFGLYDMTGNVWEWCDDWYDEKYYAQSRVDDPAGLTTGSFRVYRGGSWNDTPAYCRSANRIWGTPDNRDSVIGFRVALVP